MFICLVPALYKIHLKSFLVHGKIIAHCAQQDDTILQIRSYSDSFNKKLLYLCKMPAFKTHHFYGVDHIWVGNCNHQLTITNYVYRVTWGNSDPGAIPTYFANFHFRVLNEALKIILSE